MFIMDWSKDQLEQYNKDGYLVVKNLLSSSELNALKSDLPLLFDAPDDSDGAHRIREKNGAIRQVMLAHRGAAESYANIIRTPNILNPIKQILKNDVYIYHSKINAKESFEGTVWLWHQDYGYWQYDGVKPNLASVMIVLDPATINNGCLMVVKGSHKRGVVDHYSDEVTTSYKQWCIEKPLLQKYIKEENITHLIASPGDVVFFDCNIMHGSSHNMSPINRHTFIIVYNSIDNKPASIANPRPDWVVSRNFDIVK